MSWAGALADYAKTDPKKLASDILIWHDDRTLCIFDKFPKGHFHWLVLRPSTCSN
jgi:hypothetical protein